MKRNMLPDLWQRQHDSAQAKKAMLEKFRAEPGAGRRDKRCKQDVSRSRRTGGRHLGRGKDCATNGTLRDIRSAGSNAIRQPTRCVRN
jgi:hypothetical protein